MDGRAGTYRDAFAQVHIWHSTHIARLQFATVMSAGDNKLERARARAVTGRADSARCTSCLMASGSTSSFWAYNKTCIQAFAGQAPLKL